MKQSILTGISLILLASVVLGQSEAVRQIGILENIKQILQDIYVWMTRSEPVYQVQLSNDSEFSFLVVDRFSKSSEINLEKQYILNRAEGNTYYWRVRYVKNREYGRWSGERVINITE